MVPLFDWGADKAPIFLSHDETSHEPLVSIHVCNYDVFSRSYILKDIWNFWEYYAERFEMVTHQLSFCRLSKF